MIGAIVAQPPYFKRALPATSPLTTYFKPSRKRRACRGPAKIGAGEAYVVSGEKVTTSIA